MFLIMTSLSPPQLRPRRQVLKPSAVRFAGGLSGSSGISKARVICDLLLSMSIANKIIFPIGTGLVKTLLKNTSVEIIPDFHLLTLK